MKILVTGAAGFIGSHLCEELLKDKKHNVIGIDDFIGPTPFSLKLKNLKNLLPEKRFTFIKENLLTADLASLLEGVDVIFHLAAIPGVRSSWGNHFHPYAAHNIQALQRLLEACREHSIQTFVFASTSSVYGEKQGKVSENTSLSPLSPYGVTKLTGEKLCHVYKQSFGIPIVILRFLPYTGQDSGRIWLFTGSLSSTFSKSRLPSSVMGSSQEISLISATVSKASPLFLGNPTLLVKQ